MIEIKNRQNWGVYPTYKVLSPKGVEKIVNSFLHRLIFPFDTVKAVQSKIKRGYFVRCIYYNDYSQTTLVERAIIEYCEKYESENIIVFNTQYNGKCAFLFANDLDTLDTFCFFGSDEFYWGLQCEMINQEIDYLIKDGKIKDTPEIRNYIDTYFVENCTFFPSQIDYSESDLLESLNDYFGAA